MHMVNVDHYHYTELSGFSCAVPTPGHFRDTSQKLLLLPHKNPLGINMLEVLQKGALCLKTNQREL